MPGEQAQQRGLAGAVVPDEPDPVAFLQRHRDVAQRLDDRHLGVVAADGAAGPAEHGLLQRAGLGVEDREVDARVRASRCRLLDHVLSLHPVGHAGPVVAQRQQATAQPTTVNAEHDVPVVRLLVGWPISGSRRISTKWNSGLSSASRRALGRRRPEPRARCVVHTIGVRKNSSCVRLPMIGAMSRNRVATMPNTIETHSPLSDEQHERRDRQQRRPAHVPPDPEREQQDHVDDAGCARRTASAATPAGRRARSAAGQLLDQPLVGDEDLGALEDATPDEVPDDQADRDVRQERPGSACGTAPRRGCPSRWPGRRW